MRVLVTGGAGFIGSNLVRELVRLGHDVLVLDNLSTGRRARLLPGVDFAMGDILTRGNVNDAMQNIDWVFHLAASVGCRRSFDLPQTDSEVNVLGTLNVLEAARRARVRRLVYSSSAAVYGEVTSLPISESHPCRPESPYGCSKLCGEQMCLAYARAYDMSVTCLRYFNVYGDGQTYDPYGNVVPIFVRQLMEGQPLTVYGDGEQTRDFVHVKDVVQANLLAAASDLPTCGTYNIASGEATSLGCLVDILRNDRQDIDVVYAPARPGEVRHSVADITAARRCLNYRPTVRLEDGLLEYWKNTA